MTFQRRVNEGLILDGGLGSALLARGLSPGDPPEIWNLDRSEIVADVHRSFVQAGSEAIHTNSFGANPVRLEAFGMADRCEEINRAAASLAHAATPRFVIGDVGPTGEYLPPVGKGDESRWREAFERQGIALAEGGVDAFHVETMSDLREARAALDTLLRVADGIPVMVSLTFERKKRGFFTLMGDPLVPSLNELASMGAVAVGANCSITSLEMRELVDEAVSGVVSPLVVQPNAGRPKLEPDGTFSYDQSPEDFADHMAAIVSRGVAVVGGCCGTDARFIEALRRRLGYAAGESK